MPLVIAILAPGFVDNKEVYDLTIHFGKIVFPYLLFIALVAQFSSITNSYNRFAFGAFAPALLNISFTETAGNAELIKMYVECASPTDAIYLLHLL